MDSGSSFIICRTYQRITDEDNLTLSLVQNITHNLMMLMSSSISTTTTTDLHEGEPLMMLMSSDLHEDDVLMAESTTSCTTNLHEHEDNKLYDHDDYDDKEIHEALESFEKITTNFISTVQKMGYYDNDNEETSNLISLFKGIARVKAAITSSYAHVVEDSEMSDVLRVGWEGMNIWLYKGAATTSAWCFIREGLLKLDLVINEEEEENCCAICLEGMKSGDVKGIIEHCDHSFHFVCLNQWMKRMYTCPVCRYEMDDYQLLINGDCNYLSS